LVSAIPKESQEKIFLSRFYQASNSKKTTLAPVLDCPWSWPLVEELHKGTIEVESDVWKKGSTFTLNINFKKAYLERAEIFEGLLSPILSGKSPQLINS